MLLLFLTFINENNWKYNELPSFDLAIGIVRNHPTLLDISVVAGIHWTEVLKLRSYYFELVL